jgi:hypothetical protein
MPKEEVIWIETQSGKHVNPLHLYDQEIDIKDIARPLSFLCRYVGQCRRFYSVGQHSIHVADMVDGARGINQEWTLERHNQTCLAALLHDAAEAYTNDISRPVKYAVKGFKEIEDVILGRITIHFRLEGADWTLIKKMDNILLATEAFELMPSQGKGWYLPEPRDESLDHLPDLSMEAVYGIFMERFVKFGGK